VSHTRCKCICIHIILLISFHPATALRPHCVYTFTVYVFTSPPTVQWTRFSTACGESVFFSTVSVLYPRVLDVAASHRCGKKNTKRMRIRRQTEKKNKRKILYTYINTVLTTLWGRKSLRTRPRIVHATATRITIIIIYNIEPYYIILLWSSWPCMCVCSRVRKGTVARRFSAPGVWCEGLKLSRREVATKKKKIRTETEKIDRPTTITLTKQTFCASWGHTFCVNKTTLLTHTHTRSHE